MASKGKHESKPAASKPKAKDTGKIADADEIYALDKEKQDKLFSSRPWKKDPKYFKSVKISSSALIKMAMHAVAGMPREVMGVLQGKIEDGGFLVMDAIPLGLGSETRVGMPPEMTEYLIKHLELADKVGKSEVACGWYHSHPGYGCWLSGIDVNTQKMNQKYQDPWLAIVIDPVQTIAKGKVELGAFRTYPDDYKDTDRRSDFEAVPLDKIEDFGVHYNAYYPVDVEYFKTGLDAQLLDLLWNKYWVNTLSANPLRATKTYATKTLSDISLSMDKADAQAAHSRSRMSYFVPPSAKKEKSELSKIFAKSSKASAEQINGLMTQVIKNTLFNGSFGKEKGKGKGKADEKPAK